MKLCKVFSTLFLVALLLFGASVTRAQIRPVYDQGALGLSQLLKRLNTNGSALMIGAHPDDEDTALLTYLARGKHARTAYLSLTRGDGGQNILGPELGEALGVIRTEELLQARKLDGAEQFFTRAYDYGFSKTLDEAKSKWDEKIILCDVVRVIRDYQPLVVIAQFTGTPSDGHGQHQYAGYITPMAVKAASDPGQCSDAGPAWTVRKFYVRYRGNDATLRINTGTFDQLLGRSYFEIAMHARSQHRSQEQGTLELRGERFSTLKLVSGPQPLPTKENDIFDGLDVTPPGGLISELTGDSVIPKLLERLNAEPKTLPEIRRNEWATDALLRAAGIQIDVLSDRETAIAHDDVPVSVRLFSAGKLTDAKLTNVSFNFPATKKAVAASAQANQFREVATIEEDYTVSVPADAPLSQPYWLSMPRADALFTLAKGQTANWPLGPPAVRAELTLEIAGKRVSVSRPVQFRFADDIRGEIRRQLNIVPKVAVSFDEDLEIVSTNDKEKSRDLTVTLTNGASSPVRGVARLNVPQGWRVTPAQAEFATTRKGENTTVNFTVSPPQKIAPGSYQVTAEASVDGETFRQSMQTIAYEHIQTHRIYRPTVANVKVIDVQVAPVKVGYVRGSGDRVPIAIRQLGLNVEEIDERTLASGDLSRFDTIVVGIRAYQVRPDVVANNQRLLDFANNGGTLIVQYQLPPTYTQQVLTPFPAQSGPRVSDENAPITILVPGHPLFNFPNKITQDDFKGWVQERNLYNFSTMDPKYTGLLESHDPGEPENKGGLVIAEVGKGKFVYSSYSLFRQLPAGVPGAYRLLANLVSLPKAPR